MATQNLLGNLNWAMPSWDLFILLFFGIGVVLYGFSLGRERVLTILISIYIGLAIVSNLPYITEDVSRKFGFGPVFVLKIIVFTVSVVGLFFLFNRIGALASLSKKSPISHVILFSVLHTGLLISVILSFLPSSIKASLAPFTQALFISDLARFLWILAPIVAMFLLKKTEPKVEE